MSTVNKNIKYLRLKAELTQKQFAEKLGLKQSVIGAYEEERATPPLPCLVDVSDLFNVSLDVLTRKDLSRVPQKEWKSSSSEKEVLAITVDASGKENVELVLQKASAGYLAGYQDPEFIGELPKISIPVLPRNKTYRAFEIQGDSMLPIQPGSIIFGEYQENVSTIKNGKPYILVTQQEGIVFKRLFNFSNDQGKLLLVSDNRNYAPYAIETNEVMEVWSAKGFFSNQFPEVSTAGTAPADQLALTVLSLQTEIEKLKKK
ncbi:MAG: LexA family transcriptional regulator [Cyclobacteriaceae bacterium]|nr:LexA family transcriptional regulator [Cyclobacteriaceae bacterium]